MRMVKFLELKKGREQSKHIFRSKLAPPNYIFKKEMLCTYGKIAVRYML